MDRRNTSDRRKSSSHCSGIEKILQLIEGSKIRSIIVLIMEVPCCRGLVRLVQESVARATRTVPVKVQVLDIGGDPRRTDIVQRIAPI